MDKVEYWRDLSLLVGAFVIGIMLAVNLIVRYTTMDLDTLKAYADAMQVWIYIVYIVGIPALSVGMTLFALQRLND
jgi:hypothetical protein